MYHVCTMEPILLNQTLEIQFNFVLNRENLIIGYFKDPNYNIIYIHKLFHTEDNTSINITRDENKNKENNNIPLAESPNKGSNYSEKDQSQKNLNNLFIPNKDSSLEIKLSKKRGKRKK